MSDSADNQKHEEVEEEFVYLNALAGLRSDGVGNRVVIFSDIVNYVRQGTDEEGRIKEALRNDLETRRKYKLVLEQMSLAHIPQAAAAQGTPTLSERSGNGFRVKIRKSTARENEVYLVLEVEPPLDTSDERLYQLNLFCEPETSSIAFDPLHSGRSTLILSAEELPVRMIGNPDTLLYLVEGNSVS